MVGWVRLFDANLVVTDVDLVIFWVKKDFNIKFLNANLDQTFLKGISTMDPIIGKFVVNLVQIFGLIGLDNVNLFPILESCVVNLVDWVWLIANLFVRSWLVKIANLWELVIRFEVRLFNVNLFDLNWPSVVNLVWLDF